VRQPEFVEYVAAGEFSKPLAAEDDAGRARSSVQFVPLRRLAAAPALARHYAGYALETIAPRLSSRNVSHELRTPLTVLVGFLETVRELKLDRNARATT